MKFLFLILFISCSTIQKSSPKNYNYDDIYKNYINENYQDALKLIKNSNIDDYEISFLAGSIYFKLNNFEESIFYFKKAYSKNNSEESALHLVNLLIILNKKKEAITLLNELYLKNKSDSVYPFILGVLYKDIKEYKIALEYFNYSLNRGYEPKIDIYTNIVEISTILGEKELSKKYKKLLEIANTEISKKENIDKKKFIELELLIRQKNYSDALRKIKDELSFDEKDSKVHSLLGDLFRLNNDSESAKNEYLKSIKYDINNFDSHFGLIDLYYSENKFQEAINQINTSLKIFKDNPELFFYLGKIYEDLFDLDKAQIYYSKSLDSINGNYNIRKLKYADLLLKKDRNDLALILYQELKPFFEDSEILPRINTCKAMQFIKESKENINQGKIEKGIHFADSAQVLSPGLFTEFYYAKLLNNAGKSDEASVLFKNIYKKYNYYPAILLLNKEILGNLENNEISDKQYIEIAEFYFDDEKYLNAISFYKKIISKNNIDYINKKIGISYINQLLIEYESRNYDKFNNYIIEAKKYLKKEDLSEYQELINDKILQIEKEKELNKAQNYIENGKIENAIKIYKDLNKNINSINILKLISNLYIQKGDFLSALEYLDTVNINNYKKKEIQANLFYRLGDYSKLDDICNDIIRTNPESTDCYILMGKSKIENNPDDAIFYFNNALTIDPINFQAIIGKGRAYLRLGKIKESVLQFERGIQINKNSYEPYHYLGILYYKEKNYNISIDYFNRSIDINKDNKEAIFYLAQIYNLKQNYNKSIELLHTIKYEKEKYLDLFIKNHEKIGTNENSIETYKKELNNFKLRNNRNDLSYNTLYSIPISENLLLPPISIGNNYLLLDQYSIKYYNNKLDKVFWKLNLQNNISEILYFNQKVLLISRNQLIQINIEKGTVEWEFTFESIISPKVKINNNIQTTI